MKRILTSSVLLWGILSIAYSQTLSASMEKAVEICTNLSNAIDATTTSQLRAANKDLKDAKIVDFGDLWLKKGEQLNINGHFVFDEVFVDSLIENRKVLEFSSKYAKMRSNRSSTGAVGHIKMTTKALRAGKSASWETVNRRNAEYAIVAEPGGLFTLTIKGDKGKVLYTETVNNKKGEPVRKVKIQLPDKATRIYLEVKNNSKNDASFALLGN